METFLKTDGKKIQLGKVSADKTKYPVLREIVLETDDRDGGAEIRFQKLTEEIYREKTEHVQNAAVFGEETFLVEIDDTVTVYYTAEQTKIYALYAIRRHYEKDGIEKGILFSTPRLEFRCFRSFLPARKDLADFKRFIDILCAFGHNALMLEIGGAMEYKRHPEINRGWVEFCDMFRNESGKTELFCRSSWYPKNSVHIENAGGSFLTQSEVREIVEYCRERNIEVVPEVPSLSHADYILYSHPEFSELQDDHFPSNVCPQNEEYYKVIFDILDEVIEVFRPQRVNICHDEAYIFGYCKKCRGKDNGELFAGHITRLHDHLAEQGVKTMIWGDGILPVFHGGNAAFHQKMPWDGKRTVELRGKVYKVHDFRCRTVKEWEEILQNDQHAEGVFVSPKKNSIHLVPRDLQVMNWSASDKTCCSEDVLTQNGFYHVYGNFGAHAYPDFGQRIKKGVRGLSFSNWGATDFDALQRTGSLFGISSNAHAVWNPEYDNATAEENTMRAASEIYRYMNRRTLRQKHLKIVHTSDSVIKHDPFYCGVYLYKEDYRIGEYIIRFANGEEKTVPVYWGHNIGQRRVAWDKEKEYPGVEKGTFTEYKYEPIGETKPILINGETYYETVIPIREEVESVQLRVKDGYSIELKSFETNE